MNNHQCPGRSDKIANNEPTNNQLYKYAQKLYAQHNNDSEPLSKKARIPKIIHQIWLGSPYPEKYELYRQTWLQLHPKWKYYLWTDNDIEKFQLKNHKLFNTAKNNGEKADIFRYEILYRYGGLYIDTDCECLKPFDLLHQKYDFYAGIEQQGRFMELGNAILGARQGSIFMKYCIDTLPQHLLSCKRKDTVSRTGPYFLTQCFLEIMGRTDEVMMVLPVSYFYPVPIKIRTYTKRDEVEKWIRPESYAIHYWAASW
jgi:inositol phosphorylceramide mannosyltransferase catalytic subunit